LTPDSLTVPPTCVVWSVISVTIAVDPNLDRRNHVDDPALHGVQPAARRLAEVDGQQDQGAGNEQSEDCPAPADRLVVHVIFSGKVSVAGALPTGDGGCARCGSRDG